MALPYASPGISGRTDRGPLVAWGTWWIACGFIAIVGGTYMQLHFARERLTQATGRIAIASFLASTFLTGLSTIGVGAGLIGARRWSRPLGIAFFGAGWLELCGGLPAQLMTAIAETNSTVSLALLTALMCLWGVPLFLCWRYLLSPQACNALFVSDPEPSSFEKWPVGVVAVAAAGLSRLPLVMLSLLAAWRIAVGREPTGAASAWPWPMVAVGMGAIRAALLGTVVWTCLRRKGLAWHLAFAYVLLTWADVSATALFAPENMGNALLLHGDERYATLAHTMVAITGGTMVSMMALSALRPSFRKMGEPVLPGRGDSIWSTEAGA